MKLLSSLDSRNKNIRSFIVIAGLRFLTGIAQFSIILLLTSKLSLEDLGAYTMFTIYIGYLTLLAGFNFHSYTIRELGQVEREYWPHLLIQNGRFLVMNGFLVILLAMLFYYLNLVNRDGFVSFLFILTFAAINNQAENFLVGAGYPVHSAVNLLLRAIWILPLLILVWGYDFELSLAFVFWAWMVSELAAVSYMAIILSHFNLIPKTLISANYGGIIKGWHVGARYTFLGLLLTFAITMQRVVLGETHSKEDVGIFQFFFAMSVFLPNLIEAAVFAILLPKLIKESVAAGGGVILPPKLRVALFLLATVSVCLFLVFLALPLILSILGKEQLIEFKNLFIFIALYSLLYFASRLFHYQLYSAKKDRFLTYANIVAFTVALLSSILFIPPLGIIGAAYSLVLTGLAMVVMCGLPFLVRFKVLS